jgi:hypothetical protein
MNDNVQQNSFHVRTARSENTRASNSYRTLMTVTRMRMHVCMWRNGFKNFMDLFFLRSIDPRGKSLQGNLLNTNKQ